MARSFLDWTRCLSLAGNKQNLARGDLANQTLPSRLKRQRRGHYNSIHKKQWKAELQKPKLLRRYTLIWFLGTCLASYSFHISAVNGNSLSSARASRQVE
jgi:hypothetical protein